MFEPTIIVHGGCGKISPDMKEIAIEGVKTAACRGHTTLTRGGSAVDAVVEAVTTLENNPEFNAGHGSVLNRKGEVEMDACVIDGQTLASGGVCGLRGCANPIQVARLVMEKTAHCLLTGQGARDFMESQGIHPVADSELITPRGRARLEKVLKSAFPVKEATESQSSGPSALPGCDTVGAVAMDAHGNLATATSTGGIIAKLPGRVGDSPIIGSGGYADSDVGAVSTTGDGESIMKVCLARRVAEYLEKGESIRQAAEHALEFMSNRVGGEAGIIALSRGGEGGKCQVGCHFTSDNMPWAVVSNGKMTWGIDHGQELSSPLEGE
ncbi:isoaspartyl peptidase/l-asparaginase [Plakobranchus ocellatus]|uniref:Isoaspartyl peptidase/l-asparaginase n=1 Tax=Plakobranchus ocellatus TaxID=259542 RepID=A0AAV4CAC3_9GAST|nr:isoaspartyl peptidase/l-asparaginase [Plakobranchus ocellatus]